jgi:hypothetical protein
MTDKKTSKTPDEVRRYMSELGKKSARVNKQKGSEYFKWVRSHRKPKVEEEDES